MPERKVMVTTSWDDGHELDAKLALELDNYGLTGTFYVSPQSAEMPSQKRIRGATLCDLAQRFEIGGHTLTHPCLHASGSRRRGTRDKPGQGGAAGNHRPDRDLLLLSVRSVWCPAR